MNYIQRLKEEKAALERQLAALNAGLRDLRGYLHSPKFHSGDSLDRYVNVSDVLARLREAEDAASMAFESEVAP